MEILIRLIALIKAISDVGTIVLLIIILSKKITYFPPNEQNKTAEKISQYSIRFGVCISLSVISFFSNQELIKYDFHKTMKKNKIISMEVHGLFYGKEDAAGLFNTFEPDPGRFRCESFPGIITFENNSSIPIEIIRHCYEKNKYIIVSKKYYSDAAIGIISTSKFDFIRNSASNSTGQQ